MHSVFKLLSIISFLNLAIIDRSLTLSFTNLNPFSNKSQYRSHLTSIDNGSFISSFSNSNKANINQNLNQNQNINQNLNSNININNYKQPIQQSVQILNSNSDTSISRSKWPNMRFMRTFLRSNQANVNQLNSNSNQFINNNNAKSHYILGFNPTTNDNIKQLAKLPLNGNEQPNETKNENIGLIDWNKILTKLNQATGFKQQSSDLNDTSRASKHHSDFYSTNVVSIDDKKQEEEKESNKNILNYFTTFFSSNLNENETLNAEKEKQLAKNKQKIIQSKLDAPITSSIDLFYFDDNLLAKKQIEVLVCDKTMAIINVRKNRFKTNRTVQNCVLFDLEKRGKEAEETVKKLKLTKVDADFNTMMDVIHQCKRFVEPAKKIDSAVESVAPIKIKQITSNNLRNVTVSSNLNLQSDNKSSINLLTGIVSGTLWCGLGDLAKNYTDLGPRKDLDMCCRAHDHCPIRLRALRYDYGLLNFGIATRSHCQCDKDFFECLKNVNSKLSNTIGHIYFNVLKLQCIEEGPTCIEYENKDPKKECIKKRSLMQFKSSDTY